MAVRKFLILPEILLILIMLACDNEKVYTYIDESEAVVIPDSDIKETMDKLESDYKEKLYNIFTEEYTTPQAEDTETSKGFSYGLPVPGYTEYTNEKSKAVSSKEISIFTTGKIDIILNGFSKDSRYLMYSINGTYFVYDLYESKTSDAVIHTGKSRERAKAVMSSGFEDISYYSENNRKIDFDISVKIFNTEKRKGFDIILSNKHVSLKAYTRYIKSIDEMGTVSNLDTYISPGYEWAVIMPSFRNYGFSYGFIVINLRKYYASLLKQEAINHYRSKDYESALLKYKQSIFLYDGTAGMYYDCAVLMKLLKQDGYSLYAQKAVELYPKKYNTKAKKAGLIR